MGRMGEFEQYERDCQRRRIEQSSEYVYLEERLAKAEEENERLNEIIDRMATYIDKVEDEEICVKLNQPNCNNDNCKQCIVKYFSKMEETK